MVLIGFNNYRKVKRNERQLLLRLSRMQLGNVTRLSNYLNPVGVSSLNNILGFSTLMGNSSRSYIRNFWNKKTAMPVPGHMHKNKRLDGNNKNLYVSIFSYFEYLTKAIFHYSTWNDRYNIKINSHFFSRSNFGEQILGGLVKSNDWETGVTNRKWNTKRDVNLLCSTW